MKRMLWILAVLLLCTGCAQRQPQAQVAATTLPVYEFTQRLCQGTEISVTRLVTENVSCLHDYSLNVRQVKAAEAAELIVISGGGLEDFMADILSDADAVIDSSAGIALLECEEHHDHGQHGHEEHHHGEADAHIWLSPDNAKVMAQNICAGLSEKYPEKADVFTGNLTKLLEELDALQQYGLQQLADLSCRELITFHDGFAYFADCFHLNILKAVEEESGSEASARELVELIELVRQHQLPAIFTETNGSVSAADIIAAETGVKAYRLDMVMSGENYFEAMYQNIDAVKEALG